MDDSAFSFTRPEIIDRLKKLPVIGAEIPPANLVIRTLSSLATLQEKMRVELLEWNERDDRLHILEPTFLFYLRWRKPRTERPSRTQVFYEFVHHYKTSLVTFESTRTWFINLKPDE